MKIPIYTINSFTGPNCLGNPAAVCLLPQWIDDSRLNSIAQEMNLPATAFLVKREDHYEIRWITPEYELDLCGHGSLAAGYVIFMILNSAAEQITAKSRIETLKIKRDQDKITLEFPVKAIEPCLSYPVLVAGLGLEPTEIYYHTNDRCLAVYDTESQIKNMKPDMQILKNIPHNGVTVTAPGDHVDFVSRTFYPKKTFSEDAATGASHCLLAPYWAKRLKKTSFHARQVSERGGEIFCELKGERVLISGRAEMVKQSKINIEI